MSKQFTPEWHQRKLVGAYKKVLARGLRAALKDVRDEVRTELSGPPQSAPGRPPGKVDGDLIKAVKHSVKTRRWGIDGYVGTLDDPVQSAKGARLAGGYVGRDREGRLYSQAPRPWLPHVVRRNRKQILKTMTNGG